MLPMQRGEAPEEALAVRAGATAAAPAAEAPVQPSGQACCPFGVDAPRR